MNRVQQYMRQAEECRRMAETMTKPAHKEAALRMAEEWENMAHDREAFITLHPELREPEERAVSHDMGSEAG